MGAYAIYIWPCYALFALIVAWNLVAAVIEQRRIKAKIAQLLHPEQGDD
jgi:heme exporter protein CcmD